MKTSDFGKYYIKIIDSDLPGLELSSNNIIAFQNNSFSFIDSTLRVEQYNAVIYFRLLDDAAEMVTIYSEKKELTPQIQTIQIESVFMVNNIKLIFTYVCEDANLEKIIMAFKQNDLEGAFNLNKLLIRYAKLKRITEKQALYYILTSIDVPEVDKI